MVRTMCRLFVLANHVDCKYRVEKQVGTFVDVYGHVVRLIYQNNGDSTEYVQRRQSG